VINREYWKGQDKNYKNDKNMAVLGSQARELGSENRVVTSQVSRVRRLRVSI
jgi:hypothetical protein